MITTTTSTIYLGCDSIEINLVLLFFHLFITSSPFTRIILTHKMSGIVYTDTIGPSSGITSAMSTVNFSSDSKFCHNSDIPTIQFNLPSTTQTQCQQQGGMKYFTSWEPILSAKNFARNTRKTRQKTSKIAVIWVFLPVTKLFNCGMQFVPVTRSFFL